MPYFAVSWQHVFAFPGNYQLPASSYLFQWLSKHSCLLQLMAERCCLRHGHFWRKTPFLFQEALLPHTHLKGTQHSQPKHHYTGITVLCAAGGFCRGLIPATLPGVQLTWLMQGKLKYFKACLKSLKSSPNSRPVCRVLLAPQAMPSPIQPFIVPRPPLPAS